MCPKLELHFYNFTFNQNIEEWIDIPIEARESMSFIPTLSKLKSVVYFQLKKNPKISIRSTQKKYDVSYEQSFKAHNALKSMKAYRVYVEEI